MVDTHRQYGRHAARVCAALAFALCLTGEALGAGTGPEPSRRPSPSSLAASRNPGNRHQHEQQPLANADPTAQAALKKMMQAEHSLMFSGDETTILYRPNGRDAVQSTQTIYRNGNHGYRCEYHSPARLSGELLISNGQTSWHYIPNNKTLRVGGPHMKHMMTPVGPAMRALRQGTAQASALGQEVIAGQQAQIIQITGTGPTPSGSIKLWVDTATGAQLKTEVYDSSGKLQSTSYFTQIDYTPTFPPSAFDIPSVPVDTKTVVERKDNQLNRIPTDAEAGFHVLKPTVLPGGYVFRSASTFQVGGRKALALRYAGGLSILSLFESPADSRSGPSGATRRPRTGTVMLTQGGMQFVAIGTISDSDLLKTLQSMH